MASHQRNRAATTSHSTTFTTPDRSIRRRIQVRIHRESESGFGQIEYGLRRKRRRRSARGYAANVPDSAAARVGMRRPSSSQSRGPIQRTCRDGIEPSRRSSAPRPQRPSGRDGARSRRVRHSIGTVCIRRCGRSCTGSAY